jgi:hypothetical protein
VARFEGLDEAAMTFRAQLAAELAHDYPEVAECEVNPLILQENDAIAVDSLIVVGAKQSVRDEAVDD